VASSPSGPLAVHMSVKRAGNRARSAWDAGVYRQKKGPADRGALPKPCRRSASVGGLFLRQFLTGLLVDHLHGQPNLAAIVKAQKLDPDILTFLQNV